MYAGGTMALHVAAGDKVCTLTPTHGLSHHLKAIAEYKLTGKMPDMGELIEERRQELVEAAAELGVTDVRFLGYDDSIALIDKDIINDIADVIGEVRPDIIITHNPYDTVLGHGAAAQMTLLAADAASGMRPGQDYEPHGVSQVFFHAKPGRTNIQENLLLRVPNTIIDITDVIDKKANAMNKFRSQHYGEDSPLQRKLSEVMDAYHGIHARVPYAEAFLAMQPEVHDLLPLSGPTQELASKIEGDSYAYMTQMLLDKYGPG